MDDLQRPPADSDRERLVARIKRVYDAGLIAAADRDIRLGNVRSAQSMTELDLMSRDLDQLEAALPATGGPPQAPAAPWSAFDPKAVQHSVDVTASGAPRRAVAVIAVVVAVVLLVGAVAAVLAARISSSSGERSTEAPAAQAPGVPEQSGSSAGTETSSGIGYALSAMGVRRFLAAYRQKFHTTRVVDLTFYGDYVIVDVPVPGKARQSGWLLRDGSDWTSFGGVRATFPGSATVDTNRLAVPALMRNIARARRTLRVERPAQAYVIIRFIPSVDQVPSVDIHLINKFQESGYLATTLDGKVERAYPYGQ